MSRGGPLRLILLSAIASVLALCTAPSVRAQPLTDGSYTIDLTDLPVLGSPRAVGLGGAFGAIGEGASAMPWNPAAVGTRGHWEHDWFEWDVALGVFFPSSMSSSRFFGAEDGADLSTRKFQFYDAGLRLQFGPVGVGALYRPRSFVVPVPGFADVTVRAQTVHADAAIALFEGQLIIGGGLRFAALSTDASGRNLLDAQGAGFEAGATYRRTGDDFRASAVVRTPIVVHRLTVDPALDAVHSIPRSVGLPWEVALAGAFSFGERPLNPTPVVDPRPRVRRRRERELRAREGEVEAEQEDTERPRTERPRYGVVAGEIVIAGRMQGAVGLDGFLAEQRLTWADRITVSPRLGIEGEPWRNRMKLRGGTYLEPARSSVVSPRIHFTHGFDFRLFDFDLFGALHEPISVQISFTGDVARQYASFGVGVGIWH